MFTPAYLSGDRRLKSALKWPLFIILALILQTQISIFGYPLNFMILVVYAFVLHTARKTAKNEEFHTGEWEIKCTVFGALIGMLDDLIAGSIIGPSFLSKGLAGFFSSVLFGNVFFRWTPLLGIIVIFFLTIFDGMLQVILRMIFSDTKIDMQDVLLMILFHALANIPFGILLKPTGNK